MTSNDIVQTLKKDNEVVIKPSKVKIPSLKATKDTNKGIKKYISLMKNTTKKYLNAVVVYNSESLDFFVAPNKKSKFVKSLKPITIGEHIKKEIIFYSFSAFLGVLSILVFSLFAFVSNDILVAYLISFVPFTAFIFGSSSAVKEIISITKTGYTSDIKQLVKHACSNMTAVTDAAIYKSKYDAKEDKYDFDRYDFRSVNNVWKDQKSDVIQLIGFNKEIIYEFKNYEVEGECDLVQELNDRVKKSRIKMIEEIAKVEIA